MDVRLVGTWGITMPIPTSGIPARATLASIRDTHGGDTHLVDGQVPRTTVAVEIENLDDHKRGFLTAPNRSWHSLTPHAVVSVNLIGSVLCQVSSSLGHGGVHDSIFIEQGYVRSSSAELK